MKIQDLDAARKDEAIELIATCFMENPLFKYFEKSWEKRLRISRELQRMDLVSSLLAGNPIKVITKGKNIISIGYITGQYKRKKLLGARMFMRFLSKAGVKVSAKLIRIQRPSLLFVKDKYNPSPPSLEVHILATHPKYRKKGYATAILNSLCEEAKTAGMKSVTITTANADLIDFYKKRGFEMLGKRKISDFVFYHMVKSLQ